MKILIRVRSNLFFIGIKFKLGLIYNTILNDIGHSDNVKIAASMVLFTDGLAKLIGGQIGVGLEKLSEITGIIVIKRCSDFFYAFFRMIK